MSSERLDKIIASMGEYSRREVKQLVREGSVLIDGVRAKSADIKCDPQSQKIEINGAALHYEEYVYLMLYKPAGVISAAKDQRQRTVLDLIPAHYARRHVFPVGRLDKDTEGLLLITDNGDLAHRLLSPGKHVDKEYFVTVEGILGPEEVMAFQKGIVLVDQTRCMSARLQILEQRQDPDTGTILTDALITIQEGMYHQIKRMFGTVQRPVVYLKRLRMGSLVLDEALKPGEFRPLSEEEIKALLI